MRISTIGYSFKQGFKNIWRNKMFSIASIATMSACIFLFGLFFAIVLNFTYIMKNAEKDVAMLVYFDKGSTQSDMETVRRLINEREEVIDITYVSSVQAWAMFAGDYLGQYEDDMADAFIGDNPLANSARLQVYVNEIESQEKLVTFIEGLDKVRSVEHAKQATQTLSTFNKLVGYISVAIILILLMVAVFLISNTVAVGISIRKEEIGIMKLIGAKNIFVRAPFIIEGVILGILGAAIPMIGLYYMYTNAIGYIMQKFEGLPGFMNFLPVNNVFSLLLPVGMALGIGIGLVGSIWTIRKHLRV